MLLFIANVSVRKSSYAVVRNNSARCVWNRLSVGLKVHTRRFIDFLTSAPLSRTQKKALSRLIWISFRSVNHHYLSGRFFSPLTRCPPSSRPFFSTLSLTLLLTFSLLCLCGESVFTLDLRRGEKKTFGKLIAGKKEMISRKKRVYTTTTMKLKEKMLKEGKKIIVVVVYGRWIHKHF